VSRASISSYNLTYIIPNVRGINTMAALMASGTVVPLRLIYIPPYHRLYSYLYGINLLIMVSLVPRVRYLRQVHASSLFHVIGQYWEMQLRCLLWNCIGAFGCREWHSIALTNRR